MSLHLDAGKYALFLWPAYGLSAATLIGLIVESVLRSARWRREAEAQAREEPRP
jgi:heme exporter protein D